MDGSIKNWRAQFKIQQMAFMIVAVFIFFILVGLFFVQFGLEDLRTTAADLERKQAIEALQAWSEFPEFSCSDRSSYCIDEDKLSVLAGRNYSQLYSSFWPVASIRVYKINSNSSELVICPQPNCNYYEVYDSGQTDRVEYSSYVSICRLSKVESRVMKECEMGKLALGIKKIA
jgi:hypothetical protein